MSEEEVKETEEIKEEQSEEDEFDQAFNEATKDSDGEKEEDGEETQDPGDSNELEEQKEEEVIETNENQEPDLVQKYEEVLRNNQALEHKMRSWEGRISAANKAKEEAERKLQELTQIQAKDGGKSLPDNAEDDDEVLKEFIEEFPSLEKPIKTLVKKMASSVIEAKLKDIEPKLRQIDPIIQRAQDSEVDTHFRTLSEKHPDWKELRDTGKLSTWIESQPSIVRQTLDRVVREGSTDEVIEMFDLYKGASQKPSTQSRTKAPSTKAQNMLAVESSVTGIPKGKAKPSQDDFDSAWEEALRD